MTSPDQIIAAEVGSIQSAIILAALRAEGWEIKRRNPLLDDFQTYFRDRKPSEIQAAEAFPY